MGRRGLTVLLVVLCLALAGASAWAWSGAASADPDAGVEDLAITSLTARDSGLEAVGPLTERVLSYSWRTFDADADATGPSLAPGFRREYAATMGEVRAQTLAQQVTVTATTEASSVVSATASRVVALAFVNQATTAQGAAQPRVERTRVLVTLTRDDGEWRVSRMRSF